MSALTLIPRRWYSRDFFVTDDGRQLAEFHLSSWREQGVVSVDGIDYRLYRESPFGDFRPSVGLVRFCGPAWNAGSQ